VTREQPSGKSQPRRRLVPTPEEEEALVNACRAGESWAWRRLVERYKTSIYSVPRRFGLGPEDAAEVFQAVCLALYRGLPRLKAAKGLTQWVLVTAHRQSRDLARKRRREVPDVDQERAGRLADPSLSPDLLAEETERRVRLRVALETLPPRCANLLQWLYLDQPPLSYKEVAARWGVPEGTVGPTRARCLEKLRQALLRTSISKRRTK
jgi:RNA polymerase sigma factor (sigma-70 family)